MRWRQAISKARAGFHIIKLFTDIQNNLMLFGSKRVKDEKTEHKPWFILSPNHPIKLIWNIISVIMLLYTAIVMPFQVCFDDSDGIIAWSFTIDVILEILFILDIVVTFFSAYEDNDGNIIVRPWHIFKNYIKFWFWLDSIACFPLDYIFLGDNSSTSKRTRAYNKFT